MKSTIYAMRLLIGVFLISVTSLSLPVGAQTVTGSITGVVLDSTGSAIPSVSVKLVSGATGAVREVATGASGEFAINAVLPGTYSLAAEQPGFKRFELTGLNVTANDALSVGEIRLEVSGVTEQVTVTAVAEGAAVQTASGERSGIITSNEVENLTVINRDFAALISLQPGVVDTPGFETQGHGGNSQFNVQGSRVSANNITLDGVPTDGNDFLVRNVYVSMDSVAAVKVLTSNFQAEFGRKPGAGIQAVTKSGTRQYHGAAYWYKRHEQFNASSFFNNRNGVAEVPYRHTTAGFNLGGPLRIPKLRSDKLFFFISVEQLRESRPQPIRQVTMPTGLERQGDFSDSRDLNGAVIVVRDPLNRQPFPNNVIPASRVNPSAKNYLALLPMPNFLNTSISARRYNYQIQESLRIPKHTETARLDYNINSNTNMYGRFNYWWEELRGFAVPAGNSNWGWLPSSYCAPSTSIMVAATRILNPTMVLEGSFGLTWRPVAGSAFKRIPLPGEKVKLQFRAETYNAFNHTQFSDFDTTARFDLQGRQANARFGEFTAARPARRVQLALRLTF